MLFLEYLLLFGIFNIFNNILPAFGLFVCLLPALTIGIIGLLLNNIVKVNIVFFPIHCCIIGSIVDMSFEYEDMLSFIVLNFALFFIIAGYITSLLKHLEKNNSSTFMNRAFTVLPITSKIAFISLVTTVILLILFPHMRYSLFLNPAFHCVAYVFCPMLFIIAIVLALVYPKYVN
jgi:hypothetical protein